MDLVSKICDLQAAKAGRTKNEDSGITQTSFAVARSGGVPYCFQQMTDTTHTVRHRDTFDPANVPRPESMEERRGYIDQYIQRFYPALVPQIEEKRKVSCYLICQKYHRDRGLLEVPAVYFEYVVDKTLWHNIFKHYGVRPAPAWPWKPGPGENDMSGGMSEFYKQWRIENNLPIATPQQEVDSSSDLWIDRVKPPVVADQALRETIWQECFGANQHTGFIRGPFALNLPVWVDFETLVLGENASGIETINNDIVEPGLVISWGVYGAASLGLVVPLGLVVGSKDEASLALPQVQRNLLTLWCDVVAWFCEVVAGGTVSLASYLRVMQVTSYSMERTPLHQEAEALWQEALQAPQQFAAQARARRESIREWSPMVRQITDEPFGEAEQELGALILSNGADLLERKRRLAIVREIWLYDSRKLKVIRRAFNWLTYFSSTLDPSG
ncbi:hypothetical protein FMUND_7414 [Fusarium mundagurra]|uniref:Uncharacterized protein n=1 Tax=Fusarium mundagurra TaxID=1567541 RepID=A0A8H5YN76_9HYPO|nr:hypothetical protein FMUND_7414 [Fusarium mundagurra]